MAIYYDPPANIDDFSFHPDKTQQLRQRWHDYIAGSVGEQAASGGLFYDASQDPAPGNAAAKAQIPWNGFPKSIWEWFGADASPAGRARALASAETLAFEMNLLRPSDHTILPVYARQQDEYCEWHVDRKDGHITRISFTCEGPEYWEIMWEEDPDLVLHLYKTHVSDEVTKADLSWPEDMKKPDGSDLPTADGLPRYSKGSYNKWNRWNTTQGAMHLTHGANTLGAEITLAADATHLFTQVAEEPAFSLPNRLMCCARYGGVNRSSDPLIGAGVNAFARQGKSVTLANPIGLYIKEIAIDALHAPDGTPIGPQCLNIVRASPDKSLILRAEITPPPGAAYTLDECTFEGVRLTGGGQIARRITMSLFGLAKDIPGAQGIRQNVCKYKCCRKPSSNFQANIPAAKDCASLDADAWNQLAPVEPGGEGAVVAAVDADGPAARELSEKNLKVILSKSRAGM